MVKQLIHWLSAQNHVLYASDSLQKDYPLAIESDDAPAGLLAILLPNNRENAILWFRREYRRQLDWAGDPRKPALLQEDGSWRLHPRHPFARWTQMIEKMSRAWLDCEIDYAWAFHHLMSDMMVQRSRLTNKLDEPSRNRQDELDNFFYSAAHDAKEHLRDIRNYIQLIQFEEKNRLSDKSLKRMDTVLRMAERMGETLQPLMSSSTAVRQTTHMTVNALHALVEEIVQMVIQPFPPKTIQVHIQPGLPDIRCDRGKIQGIYRNLIRNAIQYNDSPVKIINIGHERQAGTLVFFVRDNGIGIAPEHHATIFQLFRRLHDSRSYGGGAGTGLTIVQKAVEQHGGRIWLESTPGQGTTFFFTFSAT